MNTDILQTKRLKLVPLSLEHKDTLFMFWSNHEVTQYMNIEPFTEMNQVEQMIQLLSTLMNEEKASRYTIFLKETNQIIGTCGLNYIDKENDRAEIAYDLGKNFWHNGYATEIIEAFIQWSIKKYSLNRIEAKVDLHNIPSKKLLKKLNFTEEGIMKSYEKAGTEYHDICLFSYIQNKKIK